MNVNSVAGGLAEQDNQGLTNESTPGRSLMNVNSVASGLAKEET